MRFRRGRREEEKQEEVVLSPRLSFDAALDVEGILSFFEFEVWLG